MNLNVMSTSSSYFVSMYVYSNAFVLNLYSCSSFYLLFNLFMFSIAGAIAGIVIGCLVFTTVVVIVLIAVRRRRGVIVVCTCYNQAGIKNVSSFFREAYQKKTYVVSFDMLHEKKNMIQSKQS